jgi:D-alanyl-D-alanine carboxypeptidase
MTDALYGVMLMSANEVAMGVAEHIGGSIENFSKMMNDRAKQAGALNSNFKNPHGLHDPQHYTTAYDMAMIAKQAYQLKEFRDIIGTMTYQIEPTNKQKQVRYLANQHYMYKNTTYHYKGCTGGKTGFTDEAQSTLVTFAERDGLKLVAVVMNEIGNAKYTDTIKLFDYGFNNFKVHTVYANEYPDTLPVYKDATTLTSPLGSTNIYAQDKAISIIVPKNIDTRAITTAINIADIISAPLSSNSIIGTLDFYYNDAIIARTNLKNTQSYQYIDKSKIVSNTTNNITENKKTFSFLSPILLLIALATVYITLTLYKQALRRKRTAARYRRKNKNNASN